MIKPNHSNNHDTKKAPNLKNYAVNTKKTAMDPDRNYSELMRTIRAPFGETMEEKEDILFEKKVIQLKKFAKDLETIEQLNLKTTKKVISD